MTRSDMRATTPPRTGAPRKVAVTTDVVSDRALMPVTAEVSVATTDGTNGQVLGCAVGYVWDGDVVEDHPAFAAAAHATGAGATATVAAARAVLNKFWALTGGATLNRAIVLDDIRVRPDVRGHGIGRQAAAWVLREAGAWSSEALVIAKPERRCDDTDSDDHDAAIAVLQSLGMCKVGNDGLWIGSQTTGQFAHHLEQALQRGTLRTSAARNERAAPSDSGGAVANTESTAAGAATILRIRTGLSGRRQTPST